MAGWFPTLEVVGVGGMEYSVRWNQDGGGQYFPELVDLEDKKITASAYILSCECNGWKLTIL